MKLFFALLTTALFYSSTASAQIEDLMLRGQGDVNFLGFIKVYDAYLYSNKDKVDRDILAPDVSKCLKLEYDVSLKKDDFIEGANTILSRQHPTTIIDSFKSELNQLHEAYQPVEEGDIYTLCYDAASSNTTLSLNNAKLVQIKSKNFSKLYFGIWLGSKEPIDEDLRDDLLNYSNQ